MRPVVLARLMGRLHRLQLIWADSVGQDTTFGWLPTQGLRSATEFTSQLTYPAQTLRDADGDQKLSVIVTFTDGRDFSEGPFSSLNTEVIVPTDVLVQNTGQPLHPTAVGLNPTYNKHAQAFRTGSYLAGYVIDSITTSFDTIANPATGGSELTVTLNEVSNGLPGSVLCTLTDPPSFSTSGEQTFSAPTTGTLCPKLKPGATYYVVTERTNNNAYTISYSRAASISQDGGSIPDWDIADESYSFSTIVESWRVVGSTPYLIRVKGDLGTKVDVPRNWSLLPEGLNADDEFRLMFLTPSGHQPYSTDIEYYNNIVQAHAADGHADVRAYRSWFRVLGSTPDTDARDNTGTTYTETEKGVPIYWLGGNKLADDYEDLYDDTWDDELHPTTRDGTTTPPGRVWSGSEHDGTEAFETLDDSTVKSRAFGSQGYRVRVGSLNSGLGGPLDINETLSDVSPAAYYSLSNVFKVVANNPATGVPTISGNPREGEMLTADPSAIGDPDGAENAEFTYQWVLVAGSNETDIAGATESTYVLKDAAGNKIRVKVNFTDDKGNPEGPLTSEPTVPIVDTDVLVKNTGQTELPIGAELTTAFPSDAQAFTTGPNASGYKLDSIAVHFHEIASVSTASNQLTVTLREENGDNPSTTLCTLTNPPIFASSGLHTFSAPTTGTNLCPTLDMNTTYFVVVTRVNATSSAIELSQSAGNDTDAGSAPGWSIDQRRFFRTSDSTWRSSIPYMIQVNGVVATETVDTTHRSWVENREGEATTTYENTGTFSIAQGFRTGDTAGAYEIHEISIDFDRGQPQPKAVQVRIVESSSPDSVNADATPTTYWKGGNFPKRGINTDAGTYTFNLALGQMAGTNLLQANTNYFITIESSSDDPDTAAIVRMTSNESQTSSDGWTVDDHVYVKNKTGDSGWTKQDHQARIRIAGEYHEAISIVNEPRAYESCHGNLSHNSETLPEGFESCAFATKVDVGTPGSFPSNLGTGAWLPIYETIDFDIVIWPLVPAGGWVDVEYATKYPPGIYAHGSPAIADVDYIKTKGKVRFLPGDIAKTVSINIIDDRHEDSNEYVQLNLPSQETRHSSVDNYSLIRRSAFGTIYNSEESVGTQYLHITDVAVTEGEGATAVFTVTLDAEVTAPVTVNYATEDDTAAAGTDYTAVSGTLLIPHGQTSATISVPILNDDVYNENRNFTLNLSDAANATIQDGSGKATIRDDEKGPLTAEFGTVPDSHDGVNTFEVFVNFSEGTKTPFLTMQNDVFTITNGTINRAERFAELRHRWTLTIEPNNGADVTVHLPITTDCDATGAVCTEATPRRPLSNSLTITVTGTGTDTTSTDESTNPPAVWSADMLVVSYTENSIGAASADLFSNIGGTGDLEIRSLWSSIPDRDLRLAFAAGVTGADDMTLHVGDLALEFPEGSSGNGSFKWTEIDVDWEDGETITVHIDTMSPSTETETEEETEEPTSNTPAAGLPTISGTPQVDQTLTADTSGISDAEGLANVSYQYQWIAGGSDIEDATSSSYLLTASEQGQAIQVKVTFTDDADNQESLTSAETLEVAAKPNTAAAGEPTISGTPQVEQTLTADTSGISDANGLNNVSYRYQWLRDDADIAGQTNSTYRLVSADEGKTIKVRVTFRDDADNAESLTSTATTAVAAQPAETPAVLLTASFANVPADHNGGNFIFQLIFSENVEAGYARIRDHAFTISGATIDSASRITQGSNQGWNVEVNPTGNEAITITLPETTNCSDDEAICTDDERMLSHSTEERVEGPPAISVSDATVQEAEGATLEFSVTLSHASSRTVTVSYATQDGTATAGPDYTATSATLTFNAGDLSQTVEVTVLTDSEDEGQETLTLTLSNPSQATLDDGTGTGTIENGESSSGTQEDPPAETPAVLLTASFDNMPATHNGSEFTFDLAFSEDFPLSYVTLRDDAFTVDGGNVENAQRKVPGSNQTWTITVKPLGAGTISITLPETTDCNATGAICTDDDRKLSHTNAATITGPG